MEFKSFISSGKLSKVIPVRIINEIANQIEEFLLDQQESQRISQKYYLVKDKSDRITYISDIQEIINISNFNNYLDGIKSEIVRYPDKFFLGSSEMHIRWPYCEEIPPHQDNFYHCFQDITSFKILIPISKYESPNAFLNYANVEVDQITLDHVESSTPAFSSYIPKDIISIHDRYNEAEIVAYPENVTLDRYDFITSGKIWMGLMGMYQRQKTMGG